MRKRSHFDLRAHSWRRVSASNSRSAFIAPALWTFAAHFPLEAFKNASPSGVQCVNSRKIMTHDELSDVKTVCTEITRAAVPDDVFLIEENFDDLCQPREAGDIQREGRFISPEMLVTFGAAVVTFLLSVFTDAIKDLLKKRVVETLKRLYVKKENLPLPR